MQLAVRSDDKEQALKLPRSPSAGLHPMKLRVRTNRFLAPQLTQRKKTIRCIHTRERSVRSNHSTGSDAAM